MRQLILHVGMHKTGTTSIQMSLNGLAESGVKYVDLVSPNHTGPITNAFGTGSKPSKRLQGNRTPEQMAALKQRTLERLHSDLSNQEFHTFVISGEGLVWLPTSSLLEIRNTVMKYVDRIRVFAYVRDPVGYSTSAFQQRKKGGNAGYDLTHANYRVKFEPFIEVFGRENVSLKEFSKGSLLNGSVVADFCHVWNIPFDPKREVRTNESLSEPALKLIHLFNRSETISEGSPALKRARTAMIDALAGHFKGKFELPPEFRGNAFDKEDLDWLDTHFGIRFPIDPSVETRPTAEMARFLNHISPEVVASYRELLASQAIATSPSDSAAVLVEKHFKKCLEESLAHYGKVPTLRRRLRAGLRALRP